MTDADRSPSLAVLCRVGSRFCALPIEHVAETMRPLPLEPLAEMPAFVLGLSIIRGNATPVVHAGRLLGAGEAEPPTRFLTLRVGERPVALAVDAVVGVRDLSTRFLEGLPPLLHEAGAEVVSAIGTLDSELLLLLRSARVIPESVWTALQSEPDR
jgi:purine-binding chemotaxis protein CheW